MISLPRIDLVVLFDWSTIVLTKVAGLTFKSSSSVGASLTRREDDDSCGGDVQLTECFMMLLGGISLLILLRGHCLFKSDGGFVVLQNVTRRFLFDGGGGFGDNELSGSLTTVKVASVAGMVRLLSV